MKGERIAIIAVPNTVNTPRIGIPVAIKVSTYKRKSGKNENTTTWAPSPYNTAAPKDGV